MIKKLIMFCVCLGWLQGPAFAVSQLTVGVRENLRALEFTTEDDQAKGALIDYWKMWGRNNDTEITLIRLPESQLESALDNGTIDIIANAAELPGLSYSEPYFSYNYYLFSLKNARLHKGEQFPLRVGILQRHERFIDRDLLSTVNLSPYPDYRRMLNDLLSGQIDFFLANDVSLSFEINGLDLLKLHYPEQPFYSHPVRAGTLAHKRTLLDRFNGGMKNISAEESKAIFAEWFPSMKGYRLSWPLIGLAIIVLFLTVLFIAVWLMNIKLKTQIADATQSLVREKETLRKAKDNAIRTQENIRTLLNTMRACIFALNSRGQVTFLNQSAEKWVSDHCSAPTRSLKVCFPFLQDLDDEIQNAIRSKEAVSFYRHKIKPNEESPIIANIRLKPFELEGDSLALVVIDDVTDISLKEDFLIQSQKLDVVHSLAGGVAHDFNNILAIINGSANMLGMQANKADIVKSEKIKKYVDHIFSAAEKGAATTKSLATLGGRVSVELADFAMNEAIDNVLNTCRSSMNQSVSIDYKQAEKNYYVRGDQGLIEQALLNVMINAYHAMTIMKEPSEEQGGLLTVSLHLQERKKIPQQVAQNMKEETEFYICLQVKDEGVGFAELHLKQAFTPFFGTKPKNVGTGLGLTMVQNTVVQHGGQIIIESEKGVGTRVRIYLPCLTAEDRSINQEKKEEHPELSAQSYTGTKLILLAEDNPAIAETLSEGLEAYGYKVITATNGVELIDIYKNSPESVDVVVSDLEMPLMNGDAAFFKLKEIDPDVKVIMTSGFLEDERVQKVLKAGASGFLQKPCHIKNLAHKINQIFENPNSIDISAE